MLSSSELVSSCRLDRAYSRRWSDLVGPTKENPVSAIGDGGMAVCLRQRFQWDGMVTTKEQNFETREGKWVTLLYLS
jgi:hypothetical protein